MTTTTTKLQHKLKLWLKWCTLIIDAKYNTKKSFNIIVSNIDYDEGFCTWLWVNQVYSKRIKFWNNYSSVHVVSTRGLYVITHNVLWIVPRILTQKMSSYWGHANMNVRFHLLWFVHKLKVWPCNDMGQHLRNWFYTIMPYILAI